MGKNQHVVPDKNGGWNVKGAGNIRVTRHTDTKAEATEIARRISQNQSSELFIHAVPVTIPPHSSVAGYIAFYAGKSDSWIISERLSLYLQIFIAEQNFGFELTTAANMSNYSYKITKHKVETIYRQRDYGNRNC